jgi:PAS domain S-box-containing protein
VAIQQTENLLTLAQEAGNLGIFEWFVPTNTVQASPKLLELYGLETFDGRYESWLKCVFREDVPLLVSQTEKAFAVRLKEARAEFRIVRPKDGALKWIESRSIVFYDGEGKPVRVVSVHVDVTDRKRAIVELRAFTETLEEAVRERTRDLEAQNEARKNAEESLRQAQKMEAVGQLTGGVAHDFNNLLTIVLGGLDMIGRQIAKLPPSPAVTRIARGKDMALQGAERAATLTNRLLAFSRQQALAPQAIDANKLVAASCEFLRSTLGEALSIDTVLAAGLWKTYVDPNQLENAILNLALNARDAMPDGGKITIETANCYLDENYVASLTEPTETGQYIMIAVADTGIGMDPATQDRAFDPFFTTKGVGKGTGLGLSQVYGFVRQTGGHVKIYSELDEGTTVKIYLRRHIGESEVAREGREKRVPRRARSAETILVVEDENALRDYTTEILGELGYKVLKASDGATALQLLESNRVDLLFTDVVMPGGINGRELADEAARRWPKLKVLFTTGYTRNAIVHHGRLDAGVQMIGKPFSFSDLSAKVRAVLDE